MRRAAHLTRTCAVAYVIAEQQLQRRLENRRVKQRSIGANEYDSSRLCGKQARREIDQPLIDAFTLLGNQHDRVGFPRHSPVVFFDLEQVDDIGKIGTDLHVLNKHGNLNCDEEDLLKRHTLDGTALIQGIDNLCHIVPTILYHHERWDGRGYPVGLKGTGIPLDARIVAVADAYDAMTTDRSYRAALGPAEVIRELKNGRAKQFDPHIIDEFIRLVEAAEEEQPMLQFSL